MRGRLTGEPGGSKGARRVRASGGGSSTAGKPAASAASDWYIITGCSKELLEREVKPLGETPLLQKLSDQRFELLEREVKPLVGQFLQERGLTLSTQKTSITHIED